MKAKTLGRDGSEGLAQLGRCCGAGYCGVAIIITVTLTCAAVSAAGAPAAPFNPTSCEPTVVRDYRAPLQMLPRARAVPPSGQLPFAPRHTSLVLTRSIVVGEGAVGFRFYGRSPTNGNFDLNWVVRAQIARVDRGGVPTKIVSSRLNKYTLVSRMQKVRMWLGELRAQGFYRVTITFNRLSDGKVLGRYEEYARVVKPTIHVRLTPSVQQVPAGGKVDFRIENFGTLPVGAGQEFEFERFDNGSWVLDAASPPGPWLEALGLLRSGEAGMCESFEVPSDVLPGRYRVSKRVRVGGASRKLYAPFLVTAVGEQIPEG